MKLLVSQLKQFNSMASSMKQNNILPILSYLKFDNGTITKTNLQSFITMQSEFNGSCLIDEKILMSFIGGIKADYVDISISEKSVTISSGKEKIKSPTDSLINFPNFPDPIGETVDLNEDIISTIKTASFFTQEMESSPYAEFVFIGRGLIAATNGYIAYTENIDSSYPEIMVDKSTIDTIKNFTNLSFSQNDSYNFYTNHVFKFGFVKKEVKFINMQPFSVVPDKKKVEIDKDEFISFCDTCVKISPSKVIVCQIKDKKLSMVDAAYEIDYEKPVSNSFDEFLFRPDLMSKLLKAIPDKTVYFTRETGKYYVTGNSGYVSIIMELQIK